MAANRYYRCIARDKNGQSACPAGHLPADGIEDYVAARLREGSTDGLAGDLQRYTDRCVANRRKNLEVERRELPGLIAGLSAEGKDLVNGLRTIDSAGRRLVEARIQEVGEQLGRAEASLAEVERQLAILDGKEDEARWAASMLADLDRVWDAMDTENQGKLLRALVDRVALDERSGAVQIELADLEVNLDLATTRVAQASGAATWEVPV